MCSITRLYRHLSPCNTTRVIIIYSVGANFESLPWKRKASVRLGHIVNPSSGRLLVTPISGRVGAVYDPP